MFRTICLDHRETFFNSILCLFLLVTNKQTTSGSETWAVPGVLPRESEMGAGIGRQSLWGRLPLSTLLSLSEQAGSVTCMSRWRCWLENWGPWFAGRQSNEADAERRAEMRNANQILPQILVDYKFLDPDLSEAPLNSYSWIPWDIPESL